MKYAVFICAAAPPQTPTAASNAMIYRFICFSAYLSLKFVEIGCDAALDVEFEFRRQRLIPV